MLPLALAPQQPDQQLRAGLLATAQAQLGAAAAPRSRRRPWGQRVAAVAVVLLGATSLGLGYRVVRLQAQLAAVQPPADSALVAVPAGPQLTVSPATPVLERQWSGLLEVVHDHRHAQVRSRGPVDVATADPTALGAEVAVTSPLPTLAAPQATLLGGSLCRFGKAQGLRLTYRLPNQHTVSVYRIDLNGEQFPQFPEAHLTLQHSSISLVLWREQNYLYALAAELPLAELHTPRPNHGANLVWPFPSVAT